MQAYARHGRHRVHALLSRCLFLVYHLGVTTTLGMMLSAKYS